MEVAPDGTVRSLYPADNDLIPQIFVALCLLLGGIWLIYADGVPLVWPTMPIAHRGRIMRQTMVWTLVALVLLTWLLSEPWNPIPWLDRCVLPHPPFGAMRC